MRFALVLSLFAAGVVHSAPRIDNVLLRMVPPGSTALVGVHMDQVLASDLYQKLIAQQKLPQLDQFARETGFDPRQDVREILLATVGNGEVLLARGRFNLKQDPAPGMKTVRHGQYSIRVQDTSGYCILDSSLAIAGDLPSVEAALDEWKSGKHTAAQPLLKSVAAVSDQTPVWGISTGFAHFLSSNLPSAGNGIDFAAIFNGIDSSWFTLDLKSGLQAAIHCTTATEKDAANLRDTAKGLIGLGRLSVPQNKPDLLRFWDGITVDADGRAFTINADIATDLIDQMVQMLSAGGGHGGRGASGRGHGRGRSTSGR